jgi:hypothetical protein
MYSVNEVAAACEQTMIRNDLEPEQLDLFSRMVEADRRIPRAERRPFFYVTIGGRATEFLTHPGFEGQTIHALRSDILALGEAGLVRVEYGSGRQLNVDIRPAGFRFHAEMMRNVADAVTQMEEAPQRHLDGEPFQRCYPDAYAKWSYARQMLYGEDSHQQLTLIGHVCTEAMQAFANALVERHRPPTADPNPGQYRQRLDAVIDLFKPKVGKKRAELLHAVVNYWFAASAIAERQEHGADKDGDPVTWEDARRVVFHTAIVMFEIDRTLAQS